MEEYTFMMMIWVHNVNCRRPTTHFTQHMTFILIQQDFLWHMWVMWWVLVRAERVQPTGEYAQFGCITCCKTTINLLCFSILQWKTRALFLLRCPWIKWIQVGRHIGAVGCIWMIYCDCWCDTNHDEYDDDMGAVECIYEW